MVYFCLHRRLVVAHSIQLTTVLEDPLHLPEELRFVVI